MRNSRSPLSYREQIFKPAMKQTDNHTQEVRHLAIRIPAEVSACRLDKALSDLMPEYSRATLQRWFRSGRVTVEGRAMAVRDVVATGTLVHIECPVETAKEWIAQPLELDIVAEDDSLLVINKPAGLVVHPGAGNPDGTLLNALIFHEPKLATLPRAGIVHRLDKNTSGLLVVARTEFARLHLIEQLRTHAVFRQYDAVVCGHSREQGRIEAAIGRSPHDRVRMAVVRNGKPAVSHYRLCEQFRAHSWVTVRLETGRTHQIRVHMRHIGLPLLGDPVYGERPRIVQHMSQSLKQLLRNFQRPALNASRLSLVHPGSGQTVCWQVSLPEDMLSLLSILREDHAGVELRTIQP